ncbi:GNAT family N-acetyltransferase [Haladaptatus pallidirubidus]|uniref:N-acetyltransferase SnaA n=1 Tax=Haladaptatus pallidirubidus TaxID=1008152 RepID=A0AAV3UH23_9EURY|nr:GNAT family N-acetyltransferase [Haladaptatus pallidirubidus]
MTELQIRRAAPADAERLVSVYRSAYRENRELGFPTKAESVTANELSEWIQEYRVYVAEVEGELVASVRLEATDSERVKLSRLGVHEERKGKGIGSRLLEYAEEVVQNGDYSTIWLTTPEKHPFLPELYRRRGYEETGKYPLEYREYDEIVLEKRFR